MGKIMRCGSVSLIFKRTLQPFNIKGPLKKIPRWKKEGKADLYLILENHLLLFASLFSREMTEQLLGQKRTSHE